MIEGHEESCHGCLIITGPDGEQRTLCHESNAGLDEMEEFTKQRADDDNTGRRFVLNEIKRERKRREAAP